MNGSILQVEGAYKRYGEVTALADITFDIRAGEIHCLVGENGAGKSTLIKILSGAIRPDEGKLTLFGKEYRNLSPSLARSLGIETIYQENIVCPEMSVADNIYIGNEFRHGIFIDDGKRLSAAHELMEKLGISLDPLQKVRELSSAQQKLVQLLKALSKEPSILILDEPTASFSRNEIDMLIDVILRIKAQVTVILFISHHLDEVFRIADRVTVLKDGKKISLHEARDYTAESLIAEMTGRTTSGFVREKKLLSSETVLQVKNFSRGRAVKDVSFELRRGEILGFAGMVGSGRSELARLIIGADKKGSGELFLNGKRADMKNPRQAIRAGVCLLPEDRLKEGNIAEQSIADNIMLGKINHVSKFFADPRKETKNAEEYVRLLDIKTPSARNKMRTLSGGNQQKVIVARWLMVNSEILIFDEPTRGIDVGAKEEIYRLMDSMAAQGKSIIMISSELPELIRMSDRVLIMSGGELVGEAVGEDINEQYILKYSIGGNRE